VAAIHRDHVRAGADLITANTFRTTRRALSRAGLGERAEELTRLAVRLARQAADEEDRRIHVLGSIAPLEDCFSPERVPEAAALAREHAAHSSFLAAASTDALLVETMNTRREALAAIRAARTTGLPVLASFVASAGGRLFDGDPLTEVIPALLGEGIAALLVNCTPVATIDRILPLILDLAGSTPVGVYANIGFPHPGKGGGHAGDGGGRAAEGGGQTGDRETESARDLPPAAYGGHAVRWMRAGARIIGGCCGTTPEHIAAVRQSLAGAAEDAGRKHPAEGMG
jgi:S-methylmethionine-dependent homocysteine/selenocysteine methylase